MQQFVKSLTNCPVRFQYEAFGFEGKQVGIIRIDEQHRPIYLKHDYGKLKKGEVYVRRGSSTDPTKPADPDEIALMGREHTAAVQDASLAVEFADPHREETLGVQIDWSAEFCQMPDAATIPRLTEQSSSIKLLSGKTVQIPSASSLDIHSNLNSRYYHQLAEYIFSRRLTGTIRLVVANGDAPAMDVRLEVSILNEQGVDVIHRSEIPKPPKRRSSLLDFAPLKNQVHRPVFRNPGYVAIDRNDDRTKVEIDCGSLQPGRKVWTDPIYIGIQESGEVKLTGHVFAANLSQPKEFTLSINATIKRTRMTLDELLAREEPSDDN